jgi:hypothetical protein
VTTLAMVLALISAAVFAVSTSVQHEAAESAPPTAVGTLGLLAYLVRRPSWLIGQALGTIGFALHALALHFGPIAVVQPIVISGIVFAVPARAAVSRRLPSLRELGAVTPTAVGLAVFLVASNPSEGTPADLGLGSLALVAVGAAVAGAANLGASRLHHHPRGKAFLLGITAGVLFGMVAGLVKMSLQSLSSGGLVGLLTAWPTWALVLAGAGGVLTNQRAYRVAGLSASMPVLNIVNGLTALAFGYTIFREIPRHSPLLLAVEASALACIGVGLWLLVRLEEDFLAPLVAPVTVDSEPA